MGFRRVGKTQSPDARTSVSCAKVPQLGARHVLGHPAGIALIALESIAASDSQPLSLPPRATSRQRSAEVPAFSGPPAQGLTARRRGRRQHEWHWAAVKEVIERYSERRHRKADEFAGHTIRHVTCITGPEPVALGLRELIAAKRGSARFVSNCPRLLGFFMLAEKVAKRCVSE